mmetsp:Transcript_40765/g.127566  ORF Transcript_40765/g.127566 Transcript_40765/m.127566 type:complete len:283 (-) Transcript_40765:287-1135(-)
MSARLFSGVPGALRQQVLQGQLRRLSLRARPAARILSEFAPVSGAGLRLRAGGDAKVAEALYGAAWRQGRYGYGLRGFATGGDGKKEEEEETKGQQEQGAEEDGGEKKEGDEGEDDEDEEEMTFSEKMSAGFWGLVYLGAFGLACTCLYFIGAELFPSRMNPYSVFNRALDDVKADLHVSSKFGEPIKGFGKDGGDRREGRRRYIDHYEFDHPKDGSKRVRIRFNIEGPHGRALVFAEVSNKGSDKWVYLMVQDVRDGSVSLALTRTRTRTTTPSRTRTQAT